MNDATPLMGDPVGLANDVGLYAKMVDADNNCFLGDLPQALGHLTLISAAILIDELSHS